jgi:hypothetical protein
VGAGGTIAGMKLARALIVAAAVGLIPGLALLFSGCPHPVPNPGQVVVNCTMAAVQDPAVIAKVLDALTQPDFRSRLAGLIGIVPGVTGEVIACILRSYLGQLGADPARSGQYVRARTYLTEHGYEVP